MATLVAQPWHKAFWSMKERKRLLDEYATGQQQRELESAKGKAEIAEGVNTRGDERQFRYQSQRDAAENDRTLNRMMEEYKLRGGLMKDTAATDYQNRLALTEKEATLANAAAERDRKDKEALLSAQMKMDQDAEQAKIDRARKQKLEPLVSQAQNAIMKSGRFMPQAAVLPYANELATKALNAMEAGGMRREAAVDAAVIANPNLALPGFGAVTRGDESAAKAEMLKAMADKFGLNVGGGGGGGARTAPLAPGTRLKLTPKQKRDALDEFGETYRIK